MRGLAGGIIGGMVGGLLFRSLGFAGQGSSPGTAGIGLFDILLIGALLYGIYWFAFKRRRQEAAAATSYRSSAQTVDAPYETAYQGVQIQDAPADDELGRGLDHIHRMDPSFDPGRFPELCTDLFFRIQGAWANRDMSPVRGLLTHEMFGIIQRDADGLRSQGRINRLENIAVRSVEIVEAWQESGQDFITVRFLANLLDYTVDEGTGQLVSGSKDSPVKFEEYWTFTRPVGPNPWQLSAITQP
jgi:predicted lipid-binding transport protein (Tim44 family)